jgi:hypothetical protein
MITAMTKQHPITPPPELVDKWVNQSPHIDPEGYIATQAAQWAADQELEACCEWVSFFSHDDCHYEDKLRTARRPKPPSLKEQALEQLDGIAAVFRMSHGGDIVCDKIRRALQALPDD